MTGWLEEHGWLAPAIDPLDITLSSKEVKQISYARRYVLALFNPFIIMITGMLLAVVVVPEGGWSDRFYWVIISMTTIGYGDVRATPGPMHDCPDSLSASTEWTLYCCAPPGQPPSLAADVCGVRVRRGEPRARRTGQAQQQQQAAEAAARPLWQVLSPLPS